jgi:hypothetical protein
VLDIAAATLAWRAKLTIAFCCSILVAAGAMKRSDPAMQEDLLLYRTIRDMQLP